jgi:1-deoxy-D-xylulose-5-phosphate synthase
MGLLESINQPNDLKKLNSKELLQLAGEIRDRIIKVTSINGGHVGPNLGVVELTMALHTVFNTPEDRFVFDVSHQGYVHKLLTGRNGKEFDKLRQSGGVSGFLNRSESAHDCYGAGHAGTALSAALGMAVARDHRGSSENVIAICGDAAFTCGITLEALNNIASSTKRLIVILNDNEWSIDKNVGSVARWLNELITSPMYKRLHDNVEHILHMLPGGDSLIKLGSRAKKEAKDFVLASNIFEKFGLRFVGPVDGHNLDQLCHFLEFAKSSDRPILLHVLTKKGQGYQVALDQPEKFHGASPFDIETGFSKSSPNKKSPPKYQDVLGKCLVDHAKKDSSIIGITGAMPSGTGLNHLRDTLPKQYYDVGIAEEHAVLYAAGMATMDMKPVCAIYSTFLQRAFDPVLHDVCLQDLPVVFCMDRAGLSPNDGATHHGLYDISYLRCIPNATIMQPKDEDELADMLATSLDLGKPAFIRYPRGEGVGVAIKEEPEILPIGEAEVLREGEHIAIWALGPMLKDAITIAEQLEEIGLNVTVVNARFIKPLDQELLLEHARQFALIVTMEDHTLPGGFGSFVMETLQSEGVQTPVYRVGWPDVFIDHGTSVESLRIANGLSCERIEAEILRRYKQAGTRSVSQNAVETAKY